MGGNGASRHSLGKHSCEQGQRTVYGAGVCTPVCVHSEGGETGRPEGVKGRVEHVGVVVCLGGSKAFSVL